jgi:hypothetical protein
MCGSHAFRQACEKSTTSVVETAQWHDLQGAIKCLGFGCAGACSRCLHSFYYDEQHSDPVFTISEVMQSVNDRHDLHFAVSTSHSFLALRWQASS